MTRPPQQSLYAAFEAVTFDLFGTLVHLDERRLPHLSIDGVSVPSLLAAPFERLLELVPTVDLGEALIAYFEAGAELKEWLVAESDREMLPHTHLTKCLERLGLADERLVSELARAQTQATLRAARPAEGTHTLLKRLRGRGCALGLVSNLADVEEGHALLSHLQMDSYFDAVIFSGDVGWRKPDRRIFEAALSELDATPTAVLHVGDELRADIWGAGRCGLPTVWVNFSGERFEGEYPPRLQIDRLASLADAGLTRRQT
jgi:HAD superfamily hydrolase (TIGR01549 family)